MADITKKDSLSNKDIERFLMVCLFGPRYNSIKTEKEIIVLAVRRAYRDFSRTIIKDQIVLELPEEEKNDDDYDKRHGSKGKAVRKIVCAIDKRYTKEYAKWNEDLSVVTKYELNDYDKWHENLCNEIVEERYTYGQAQKWVNMTMKYLLILNYKPVETIIDKLHIPLDSIIIEKALDPKHPLVKKDTLGKNFSWSRIIDYNHYMKIQEDLKSSLSNRIPILWEFNTWNESSGKE